MISSFRGPYRFLSNFYPCSIEYEGLVYPSTEHAFQAAKSPREDIRRLLTSAHLDASEAKRMGGPRGVTGLPADWDARKDTVMMAVCWYKFYVHRDLRNALLATGDEELVEGNTWGDVYWGVCNGVGRNQLGRTLMRIRETLRGHP